MAPSKKKVEDEAPSPEECLPQGFSVGCNVYWIDDTKSFEDSAEVITIGLRGSLVAAAGADSDEREDGSRVYFVEFVVVQFDGHKEQHKVPLKSLSLQPCPLEMLTEFSTGLKLPLTGKQVEQIWFVHGDLDKLAKLLVQLLHLEKRYKTQPQRDIVCDYHIFNLTHAKSLCLSPLQAATFIAIMQHMLDMIKSRPALAHARPGDMCTVTTCFKKFEQLILTHSARDPPSRLDIFRGSEVRLLTDFAAMTLFKHFLLYQYCVNFDCEVQTLRFGVAVERPLAPPELAAGSLKARRSKSHEEGECVDRGSPAEAAASEKEMTEEQEIELLVQEKLRETEAKLEAQFQAREEDLRARLEEEREQAAKEAAAKQPPPKKK
mmetsp:Transcript_107761/g.304841  ORF Transcript_107761/g.304841 Transcript_107761/m.304841 type:complete len:377 (-) Transcript_107761:72-1202(-)